MPASWRAFFFSSQMFNVHGEQMHGKSTSILTVVRGMLRVHQDSRWSHTYPVERGMLWLLPVCSCDLISSQYFDLHIVNCS